jgi:hypothetical protein
MRAVQVTINLDTKHYLQRSSHFFYCNGSACKEMPRPKYRIHVVYAAEMSTVQYSREEVIPPSSTIVEIACRHITMTSCLFFVWLRALLKNEEGHRSHDVFSACGRSPPMPRDKFLFRLLLFRLLLILNVLTVAYHVALFDSARQLNAYIHPALFVR